MFNKKKCQNCSEKVSEKYDFCPSCGKPLKDKIGKEEDFGLLGQNDSIENLNLGLPKGLNMIFNALIKNLDSQFKELEKGISSNQFENNGIKKRGISINISTSGNKPPVIRFNQIEPKANAEKESKPLKTVMKSLSKSNIEKMMKLKKVEPETKIRRFSDTVIYEIKIPGVKSLNDISIIQLENSIEVKAVGDEIGYLKIIPINLPIRGYELENEVLEIELQGQ